MQLHQIDLVPGESIRVGRLTVTLVAVNGHAAELHVEETGDDGGWMDPCCDTAGSLRELAAF
jgi:hypothetical protein